jgi:hypothetical protein
MKTDVLIVPTDTLVLGEGRRAAGKGPNLDGRFSPDLLLGMVRNAYVSTHCSQGWTAYERGCASCSKAGKCDAEVVAGAIDAAPEAIAIRLETQLLATGIGERLEPLYPVPDDLLVEPGPDDAVWAQPAYLEAVSAEIVQHDLGEQRLLVASTRNLGAHAFDAFLTRKGVRVWAERKPQRLTEGEHYLPFRRLFEVEERVADDGRKVSHHLELKPGVGFLLSVETPDDRPGFALPVTVDVGRAGRTVQVEAAQYPQPTIEGKSRKRWRMCMLSTQTVSPGGWPDWVDGATSSTRAPFPEGGKVVAVAKRFTDADLAGDPFTKSGAPRAFVPVGTTLFIEFEEPVRIEQSAGILAGGS